MPRKISYKVFPLVFFTCLFFSNPPPWALEGIQGFRGIQWGEFITNITGMIKIAAQEGIDIYRRENDQLEINGSHVKGIEYYFFKDRFMGLYISFEGYASFNGIRKWTITTYGPGEKKNYYLNKFTWLMQNLLLTLDYDPRSNAGFMLYCYLPLWKEKMRAEGQSGQ